MMRRACPTVLVVPIALIAAAAMPGCLISSRSNTAYSGRYISESGLSRIQVGKSKPDFVQATLGEPTSKSELDDGGEIWRYEYTKTTSGSGTVFLLFSGSNHTEKSGSVCIRFRDGVVAEKWRD